MHTPDAKTPRISTLAFTSAAFTLALWQIRQVWRLFLLVTIGMIATVVLVCALPLFSQVTTTSGLRNAFTTGQNELYSFVQGSTERVSTPAIKQATQRLTKSYRSLAGTFFSGAPDTSIHPKHLTVISDGQQVPNALLEMHGYDLTRITPHIKLLQGRLPRPTSSGLEVALPPDSMGIFKAHLGSTLLIYTNQIGTNRPLPVKLTVVGVFAMTSFSDDFWHSDSFASYYDLSSHTTFGSALVSNDQLLTTFDALARAHPGQAIDFTTDYYWYYPLNVNAVKSTNTGTLQDQLNQLSTEIPNQVENPPFVNNVAVINAGLTNLLQTGINQTSTSQVSVIMLTVLMVALILFFLSLMTGILVNRQAEAIALTSSRGASFRQIFMTFVIQSILLGLFTLIITPFLVLPLVHLLFQFLFSLADQSALNALPANPLEVALELRGYLLLAVVIAVLTMSLAVWGTLKSSTLGRSSLAQRPFWQRFYVDLLLVALGLLVYAFYSYLSTTGSIDPQQLVLFSGPSMLSAATLLTLGGILFYLRCFPWLLRVAARLAARRSGIVPLLSLVIMARAPRQSMRTALLLVFTIAFAIFSLVFTATQTQRTYDLAAYRVGADFSGEPQIENSPIPSPTQSGPTLAQQTALYQRLPGVLSASFGIDTYLHSPQPIEMLVVNSDTFASTVTWSQEDPSQSEQSIQHMLTSLTSKRSFFATATKNLAATPLPAIVDTATSNLLHLTVGQQFTLNGGVNAKVHLIAIGIINHIPSMNDQAPLVNDGTSAMLIDYQSYVNLYKKTLIDPNNPYADLGSSRIWLRTRQDATSLANVRRTLTRGSLAIPGFTDRAAIYLALQHDPLYFNLLCALTLGVALALLLALLGNITSAWLHVRNRLRSLAVLRALGTTPAQLATLLAWEQGIVYLMAIVLGVLAGAFFTAITLSSVVFSGIVQVGGNSSAFTDDIFLVQFVPSLHIVIPSSLLLALGVLLGLCIVALAITTYTVSRPSLSQTLRLGEDYVEDAPLFVARTSDQKERQPRSRRRMRGISVAAAAINPPPKAMTNARMARGSAPATHILTPMRHSWAYLLLTGLGVVISIMLACGIPLFSQIAATAALRDVLKIPENQYVSADCRYGCRTPDATAFKSDITDFTETLNTTFLDQTKSYFNDQPVITIDSGSILPADINDGSSSPSTYFYAMSERAMAAHMDVIAGHLPQSSANSLQVALTPEVAGLLKARIGDTLTLHNVLFPVQVVGLFRQHDAADPLINTQFVYYPEPDNHKVAITSALVSSEGFIKTVDTLARTHTATGYAVRGAVAWHYRISDEQINSDQLDDLITTLTAFHDNWQPDAGNSFSSSQLEMPLIALNGFQDGIRVSNIPIITTSLLIIGLILLFLSFMADLIVERESSTIAILRTRGATRRQIFAAFFKRTLLLNILGLILGLILVIPIVSLLTRFTLISSDQGALSIATDQPLQALLNLWPYALGCILIVLGTMTVALYRASGADYLSLRRQAARSTLRPFWQRFYLDVVGTLIALLAYGFSVYLTNAGTLNSQVNVQVKSPLILTATICLILACTLFFVRIFPLLLRLGTALATRNKNVAPMLALAQMARSPGRSIRIALLLIFSIAFVVFVSLFTATQSQHINDVASYWSGADFSGPLTSAAVSKQLPALQNDYTHLAGVQSAATGFVTTLRNPSNGQDIKLIATDPTAFLHTVIWPDLGPSQPQNTLSQQLADKRVQFARALAHANPSPDAEGPDIAVPALVDATNWQALGLTAGKHLRLQVDYGISVDFTIIGEVAHIPTINDSAQTFDSTSDSTTGMLVDYQSYALAYNFLRQRTLQDPGGPGGFRDVPPTLFTNYVWLNTRSDDKTVGAIRQTLSSSGPLQLSSLYDRRATAATLNNNPLNLNLLGILLLGALGPLLLIWLACLIASWSSARQRQTLFGILRALGSTPRQLMRVLAWEQGIVYGAAIVLGTLFGLLMAFMTLPSLVLTSVIPGIYTQTPGRGFQAATDPNNGLNLFAFQNTPPTHTVVPPSLTIVLGLLVLLAIAVVVLMTRSTMRMGLASALRLNED